MAKTYTSKAGDTFETVSIKFYGVPDQTELIAGANPQVLQPFFEGTVLKIPPNPNVPPLSVEDFIQGETKSNELKLFVDGEVYPAWAEMSISSQIDKPSSFSFKTPFIPTDKRQRETFQPFTYKEIAVFIGSDFLFSGFMLGVKPSVSATDKTLNISGYSRAAVLNDCNVSISSFPVEFNQVGLFEISKNLAFPFGIRVEFETDQGAVFDKVALKPDKKILAFLAELAKQRNGVFGDNEQGALVYRQATKFGSPVAKFQRGAPPVQSITPNFKEQQYFSEVSGIASSGFGGAGSTYTAKNPFLNVKRTHTFKARDSKDGNLKTAVDSKIGLMFASAVSYKVEVSTWRDPEGNIWKPNTTVLIKDENAMIYEETEMLVKSVQLRKDKNSESAVLELVLQGSYSGQIPERLPWL